MDESKAKLGWRLVTRPMGLQIIRATAGAEAPGSKFPQCLHRRGVRKQPQDQQKVSQDRRRLPHEEGIGLSIEFEAFPTDGCLVVLPPDSDDRSK